MPAADGVDARTRRVAARLFPTLVLRVVSRPAPGGDPGQSARPRHAVGGHPARAARVARALQALEPEGWASFPRVPRPGGGVIDHVLVGPAGVVVVDSQAWVGQIEVTRGVVQQNGFWREPECAEVARTAGSVAAVLPPAYRSAVRALICVAQHDLAPYLVSPGVHVVGVTGVAALLRSLPPRLEPGEIVRLCTHLQHTLVEFGPLEQLTTAEFDRRAGSPGSVARAVEGDSPEVLPVARPELFVPVATQSLRSAARSAARRRGPVRRGPVPRGSRDWRAFGTRLLVAVLVALGVVVLGPELLPRPVGPTADRPSSTSTTTGPGVAGVISARTDAIVTEVTVEDTADGGGDADDGDAADGTVGTVGSGGRNHPGPGIP